jgi:hypothetical protein
MSRTPLDRPTHKIEAFSNEWPTGLKTLEEAARIQCQIDRLKQQLDDLSQVASGVAYRANDLEPLITRINSDDPDDSLRNVLNGIYQ